MTTGAAIAGKYRLLRQLGKGSMAEVWAAEHVELKREVALKLIYEGSPELATRLKREAKACGKLYHPNVVRVYDSGETDAGDPFLVMELLHGETLAERLADRGRLAVDEALTIILRVILALGAAHDAGIVHRDLKPANIFLSKTPAGEVVKVLDFGVSKLLAVDELGVTTTGAIVGSPAYMSPEQARAIKEIDARADLWSVGVLMFELLTGSRPFPATTVVGVVTEILAGPIPTLAEKLPGVDPRLDAAVRRCLTRDVALRMPSAAALAEALAPVLAAVRAEDDDDDDQATIARPPSVVLKAMLPLRNAAAAARAAAVIPRPPVPVAVAPRPPEIDVSAPDTDPDDGDDPTAVLRANILPLTLGRKGGTRLGAAKLPAPPPLEPPAPPESEPPASEPPPMRVVPAPRGSNRGGAVVQTTTEVLAAPPTVAPTSDDMPTIARAPLPEVIADLRAAHAAKMGARAAPPPRETSEPTFTTRVIANPYAFQPPPAQPIAPLAPLAPAFDTAPTLRRTPQGLPVYVESNRPTLVADEVPFARRNAAQVLWMTAIAGIVVGLVVFAGLSLLR